MREIAVSIVLLLSVPITTRAQEQPIKFIADTLVVQASGTYEADPDLATLSFDISTQDKELAQAYSKATQAMQQIVTVAQKNGLKKEEISTGVLTLTPSYDLDRNKKPKQYYVHGEIDLKVHDFSKIGPILDDSLQGGLADFRSLTYTLENEEAAKERAVADAMRNAVERAKAALMANNQKAGAVRYASVDVQQLVGVAQYDVAQLGAVSESVEVSSRGRAAAPPPPPPPVQPAKITVTATVQCAFQIQ
ncbi:MAG TPA: SIMPL domain-containing protein [Candidatus Acidoferrales bacterium]|nr:SIMPL domain-containing protein [Candidatus Acidoferrales bacterium]